MVEKARAGLDEPQVFYSEGGKSALVMTHSDRADADYFHTYTYKAEWLPIEC